MQSDPKVCPVWMAYTFDNPLRKLLHNPTRIFAEYLQEGMTALDMGCGLGHFSLGMARIIGKRGKVISVDLQQGMLEEVLRRARRKGLSDIITIFQCEKNRIGWKEEVDFINCFWMIHETPDPVSTFAQLAALLKRGGILFLADPKLHVAEEEFRQLLFLAENNNLKLIKQPKIVMSYSAVFRKM